MGAMVYDIVPPDSAGTIESLSTLGRTFESAISDLVDNSIDVGAGTIDIDFHWDGPASYISVADVGNGMIEAELQTAMAMAARVPRTSRSTAELGRFGLGLNAASFSQASLMSAWTRSTKNKQLSVRIWDLQRVASSEWRLLAEADKAEEKIPARVSTLLSGPYTVMLWQGLSARPTVMRAPAGGQHTRNVRQ